MPDLVLPVTEKEYKEAGSKFIAFPPDAIVGDTQVREIELGMPDWDTPGQSIKFPVTVTQDGQDKDKKEKISCGVTSIGVWKLKAVLSALGVEYKKVGDKVAFNSDDVTGISAFGIWTFQEGRKGGDPNAEKVKYPKLTDITAEAPATQETIM